MKHIVKGREPSAFADWKSQANANWQPTYAALSGQVKQAVKDALLDEQGHICCYCERRLQDDDSHIEHLVPQSDSSADPLDFGNLLCSCQKGVRKGEPRHCGNLKGGWFDPALLVSPLDKGCENRFAFLGNGEIKPKPDTDQGACETIEKLGLNIRKLVSLREGAIDPFLDEKSRLSAQEFQCFVSGYLQKTPQGQYGEFWTTIRYLFQ